MEKAREQLDQEREKLARQLAKEREKLAAEREKLATEREKLAAERERLAERRAKLKQAAAAAAAAAPMDVDDEDDPSAGLGDAAPDEPLDAYPDASRVRASTAATTLALSPEPGLADGPELVPSSKPRKRWYLPAIFTGGAALVVAAGIGISQYRDGSRAERSITPTRTETSAQSSPMSRAEPLWTGAATVDSAGGTISSSVPVMPPTQPYIPRGVSIPAARPYAAVGAEPPIAGGSVDRIGTSSGSSQTVPPVMRVGTESTPPRMDVPPRPDSPRVVPTTPAPGIDTAAIRRLMNGLRVLTPRPDSLGRPDTGIRRPPVIPPPDTGRYR